MPQLMWIRINSYLHNLLVLCVPHWPQLCIEVRPQRLNLVTEKLTDTHINSRNTRTTFPKGSKTLIEPQVLQYLAQGNPTLELHRRQDSMDKKTQQQVTKVGNNSLPGSGSYPPGRMERITELSANSGKEDGEEQSNWNHSFGSQHI